MIGTVVGIMANIGTFSVASKALSVFKSPISKNLIIGTCEAVGVFFAASMAGDVIGKYAKEQVESIKDQIMAKDKASETGTDEKEVKNG